MATSIKNLGEVTFTISELDADILTLKKDKEKQKRQKEQDESAEQLYSVYQSYIKAGFTPEQSWEMITIYLKK